MFAHTPLPWGPPQEPPLESLDDQFRRTIADRKRTETELLTLKAKLQEREEDLARVREENLAHISAASTSLRADMSQQKLKAADAQGATVLHQQISDLKSEVDSERARRREMEVSISQEKLRIEQQMEEYHVSIGKRLLDTEKERDRLSALLLQREQEGLVKEAELKSSYKENTAIRDKLEQVAKDLVERNKRHDEIAAKKYAQYEEEIKRGKAEQMKILNESKELRDQLLKARNECAILVTQCDTAQGLNTETMTDLQVAQQKANQFAIDLHEARNHLRHQEEVNHALREENEGLANRVGRLEAALQGRDQGQLAEAEKYAALRLQYVTVEDEIDHIKANANHFIQRLSHAVGLVYHEVRKLLDEADSSRESFTQLVLLSPEDNPPQAPRVDDEIPHEPMDAQEMSLEYLARCVDILGVIWEETHALKLDTRHEVLRRDEYRRQVTAMREAYEADHAHMAELNGRIHQLTYRLNLADREKSSMTETLKESERWMDEAVRCTEEQKSRSEQLMVEKERLQTEVHHLMKQMETLKLSNLERDGEIAALTTQKDRLYHENWEFQKSRTGTDEESGKLRELVATMRSEAEMTSRALKRAQQEVTEVRDRCSAFEADVRFAKKKIDDLQTVKAEKDEEIAKLMKESRKLREEVVLAQREKQEALGAYSRHQNIEVSLAAPETSALKDLLKERDKQFEILRKQRDDADGKAMKAAEENQRLQARLKRDAELSGTPAVSKTRAVTPAERVRDLESRVTALLSSREIDSWRFK